ncbi:hypothetical protein BDR26DRAFT_497593 [Obelidium mucronatum]|nr:hypothetical protein BDR26DRAFT_497593 [Obelidium mucronatum]
MSKQKKSPPGKGKADSEAPIPKTGVYIFPDLSRYEGAFKEADGTSAIMRHGEGKHISPGYVYTGSWELDKMHGKGRLEFANGAVYDGYWKDNKFMGQGTFTFPDTSQLTGEWDQSRINGPGTFQDKKGQNWIGLFSRGSASALSAEIL